MVWLAHLDARLWTFQHQVKIELHTADCFSTRQFCLCHRPGSNMSEIRERDRRMTATICPSLRLYKPHAIDAIAKFGHGKVHMIIMYFSSNISAHSTKFFFTLCAYAQQGYAFGRVGLYVLTKNRLFSASLLKNLLLCVTCCLLIEFKCLQCGLLHPVSCNRQGNSCFSK